MSNIGDEPLASGLIIPENLSVRERLEHILDGGTLLHGLNKDMEISLNGDFIKTNGFNPNLAVSLLFNIDIKFSTK